jgi:hypothetical protein
MVTMVTTCARAVGVHAPRVDDRRVDPETVERQRFSSASLPASARETPRIDQLLPLLLYLHGLSSGDFEPALGNFWAWPRAYRQHAVKDSAATPRPGSPCNPKIILGRF